ncbi:MAG: hypothetical protein H6623_02325 [Bdellovibrionaceae bacterium]|nr:hypothetical protein [Pseudobdellovibrionaceae bacterium]
MIGLNIIFFLQWTNFSHAEVLSDVSILQKKCMIELQQEYVPMNCFRWVSQTKLPQSQQIYLRHWFNSVCKKVLQKDANAAEFHMTDYMLADKPCQQALLTAFQEWSYQAKVTAPGRLLEVIKKSGKKIETTPTHALEKKSYKNSRTARRRPN